MNDATRRVAEGWGFEPELAEITEDVDIDYLSFLLLIDQNRKVDKIMADVSALETAINSLTAADESVATALSDLRDEIASLEAGTISQDTIDSLTGKVTTAVTALGNAVTPAAPPAEETPPAPAE